MYRALIFIRGKAIKLIDENVTETNIGKKMALIVFIKYCQRNEAKHDKVLSLAELIGANTSEGFFQQATIPKVKSGETHIS